MTLTLPQHSNTIYSKDNPAYGDVPSNRSLVAKGSVVQKTPFCMTLWLIMTHHHNKCGEKQFCLSEDIIQKNIHWHSEVLLWPWSWTQQSIFFPTRHSDLHQNTIKPSLVAKGSEVRNKLMKLSYFSSYEPSLWPWSWDSKQTFPRGNPAHNDAASHQVW